MSFARTLASIVTGALLGAGIGLIVGAIFAPENPFYAMSVGIAVGAGVSVAWDTARGRRR